MIDFKSGDLNFSLPLKYGDLTFSQFFKLRKSNGSISEVISILSGIEKEILGQCNDLDLAEKLEPYLDFLKGDFDCQHYFVPDTILVDGVRYPKPKDLNLQTVGQKWHLEDEYRKISAEGGNDIDLFPLALAIYLQPTITGKSYNSELVDSLLPKMMEVRLEEGFPLASFFLTNYERSLKLKAKHLHTHHQMKKYVQELTDLQSSETFQQFSPLRRFLIKLLKKLSQRIMRRYTLPFFMNRKATNLEKN